MNTEHNYRTPLKTSYPATRSPLDVNLPVGGVSGERARILVTDRKHPLYPIVVSMFRHDGTESEIRCVTRGGNYIDGCDSDLDIVNL